MIHLLASMLRTPIRVPTSGVSWRVRGRLAVVAVGLLSCSADDSAPGSGPFRNPFDGGGRDDAGAVDEAAPHDANAPDANAPDTSPQDASPPDAPRPDAQGMPGMPGPRGPATGPLRPNPANPRY